MSNIVNPEVEVDPQLLSVLTAVGCPSVFRANFKGYTLQELQAQKVYELRATLRKILPTGSAGLKSQLLEKISAIGRPLVDQTGSDLDATVKIEWSQASNNDGDTDEVTILDEVINVAVLATNPTEGRQDVCLISDDDEDDSGAGDDNVENGTSASNDTPTGNGDPTEISVTSGEDSACSSMSLKREHPDPDLIHVQVSVKSLKKLSVVNKKPKVVDGDSSSHERLQFCPFKWAQFPPNAVVDSLECLNWNWTSRQHSFSVYRLLQSGGQCSSISKLKILTNAFVKPKPNSTTTPLDLPNLSDLSLTLRNEDDMNFEPELKLILKCSNILSLEINCDENNLQRTLAILGDCNERLHKLKSLSLINTLNNATLGVEFSILSQLTLPRLESLFLDYCLSLDSNLENLLQNFAVSLKQLRIIGCFLVTTAVTTVPKVEVVFPKMPQLEIVSFGEGVDFDHVYETLDAKPAKRRNKCLMQSENEQNTGTPASDQRGFVGPIKITLGFPEMPRLHTLILCSLYSVTDFHFSKFPVLEVFRVASDWHLAVPNYPLPVKEGKKYLNLKQFQLPDGLMDHTLIPKIPLSFPHIEKIYTNLPSVKVLRALANTFKSVASFRSLYVRTQFDFASSLEYCFAANKKVEQSKEEKDQIKVLKKYKHYKEYVREYGIQLPTFDANGKGFDGLYVLREKLSTGTTSGECFDWTHTPRILRLPRGNYKWNDDRCDYSDTLIGFKKFPYEKLFRAAIPRKSTLCYFDIPSNPVTKTEAGSYVSNTIRSICSIPTDLSAAPAKKPAD